MCVDFHYIPQVGREFNTKHQTLVLTRDLVIGSFAVVWSECEFLPKGRLDMDDA